MTTATIFLHMPFLLWAGILESFDAYEPMNTTSPHIISTDYSVSNKVQLTESESELDWIIDRMKLTGINRKMLL
jgi:hypothetical protein